MRSDNAKIRLGIDNDSTRTESLSPLYRDILIQNLRSLDALEF